MRMQSTSRCGRMTVAVPLLLALSSFAAADGNPPRIGATQGLDSNVFVEVLDNQRPAAANDDNPEIFVTTRGLGVADPDADRQAPVRARAADLEVNFALNSAELTPQARSVLTELATALKSPALSDQEFLLEGHTDATGSESHNLWLSDMRAKAVKEFLVGQQQVPSGQLRTVGKGEREPLAGMRPENGLNRRVRIADVTGG